MEVIASYWKSADGTITVYHAPFEDVLAAGLVPVDDIALVHDDPPYGVNANTKGRASGRTSKTSLGHGGEPRNNDFPSVVGDTAPFDAAPLLALDRPTVIWGGHLCQPALPRSTSLIFWDKREDTTPDDNGDGEAAWTNLGGPIRRFSHLWRGTCRASETGVLHLHGTQKPVALSLWVFEARAKLQPGSLVFVPHGGSGPDLPACRAMASGMGAGGLDLNHFNSVRGPVIPKCTAAQQNNPLALCSTGPINVWQSTSNQTYKGLLLRADKRFSHGFQMLASYASSSNIGTPGTGTTNPTTGATSNPGLDLDNWHQKSRPLITDYTQALLESIRTLVDSHPPETTVYPGHMGITTLGRESATNPFLLEIASQR